MTRDSFRRVIVTGSRKHRDYSLIWRELGALHQAYPIACVIQGECPTGADHYARAFARMHGIACAGYPAAWTDMTAPGVIPRKRADGEWYNANAGHDRNLYMACPPYTTDLTAASLLLAGRGYTLSVFDDGIAAALIQPDGDWAYGSTPPLAIVLAAVRAYLMGEG